jgi:glutathione gamma-glutamylcysteinyltransferase
MVPLSLSILLFAVIAMTNKPTSFYKRTLPDSCTAFSSKLGKDVFSSALANHGLKSFFSLIQQFSTQSEPAYCGLTTLVMVLNALSVDALQPWKGPWRWFSEEMLNCCVALDDVKQSGITLQDFDCLARCQGLTLELAYADDDGLAKFREAVQEACVENTQDDGEGPEKVLAVSYSRKVLSQTGSGHFSPIAAYDPVSDQVLILDTARFKYGAHWTKLELLYNAMKPIDVDTGKSRGYALMSFKPGTLGWCREITMEKNQLAMGVQPMSLLFTSRLNQSPARKKYKAYLASLQEVAWDQILEYWSDNNGSPTQVWDILEPLPNPKEEEQKEAVRNVHQLIEDLSESYNITPHPCDSQNQQTCTSPYHALFVVYLASIDEASRIKIVKECAGSHSQLTMEQLWNEAALIATAIETSDQTDLCGCNTR